MPQRVHLHPRARQAESVSELVGARTAAAADSALAGLRGGVGSAVSDMRRQCLDLLAELEARCGRRWRGWGARVVWEGGAVVTAAATSAERCRCHYGGRAVLLVPLLLL